MNSYASIFHTKEIQDNLQRYKNGIIDDQRFVERIIDHMVLLHHSSIRYTPTKKEPIKHGHYFKRIPEHATHIDIYRVLEMFEVNDHCRGHAIKKLMMPGKRGAGKDELKDVQEAIDTLERWKAMRLEDGDLS